MTLLQPSFRGRLRLFFAVIVIVPMVAVGVVLFQLLDAGDNFKLDSRLAEAQTARRTLQGRARGGDGGGAGRCRRRRAGVGDQRARTRRAVQQRLISSRGEIGAQRIELVVDGLGTFETGTPTRSPPRRAELQDNERADDRRITVSVTTAQAYARGGAAAARGPGPRGPRRRGAGDDAAGARTRPSCPTRSGADVAVGGAGLPRRRGSRPSEPDGRGDDRAPADAGPGRRSTSATGRWCRADARVPRARVGLRA